MSRGLEGFRRPTGHGFKRNPTFCYEEATQFG